MTPAIEEQYVHKPVGKRSKNRKYPQTFVSTFDFSFNWLRFRLLKFVTHPHWMRRCDVSNLMVEGQYVSLESAQRLLADMRNRQLQCAKEGKIKQSADYALKAQRLRKAIELRLKQQHAS